MICPRCGNEWEANKGPCTRCGLVLRMSGQSSGTSGRTSPPPQNTYPYPQQTGNGSSIRPQSPNAPLRGSQTPNTQQSRDFPLTSKTPPLASASQPSLSAQLPSTPRPSSFPVTPPPVSMPNTLPGFSSLPHGNDEVRQAQQRQQSPSFQGVPQRPQSATTQGRSTDSLGSNAAHSQASPRSNRLVTDPLGRERDIPRAQAQVPSSSFQVNTAYQGSPASPANGELAPDLLLRGGRYRLQEMRERQPWLSEAYEAIWVAQDAQRGASQVTICEVRLPESNTMVVQSTLRTAMMALSSVGRHPHIPALWDAFSDAGRHFFVFEPIEGESLMSRMRRTGRALPEQEVIECCLQLTEVLELLAQQSPPIVHGLIRPEHIIIGKNPPQFVLSNFSIILAGGATQFISGIDRTYLSPYAAPEFVRGSIDVRSDLFSLLATAYHAVTGSVPAGVSGSIPQALRLNPNISTQFDAILSRGLRPVSSQRYQRPSELRQDLLAMHSVSGSLVSGNSRGQHFEQPVLREASREQHPQASAQNVPDSIALALQSIAPPDDIFGDDHKQLLPRPEELPPLEEKDDRMRSAIWLAVILVALIILVYLSRGII
jgi:hypothetical protein